MLQHSTYHNSNKSWPNPNGGGGGGGGAFKKCGDCVERVCAWKKRRSKRSPPVEFNLQASLSPPVEFNLQASFRLAAWVCEDLILKPSQCMQLYKSGHMQKAKGHVLWNFKLHKGWRWICLTRSVFSRVVEPSSLACGPKIYAWVCPKYLETCG